MDSTHIENGTAAAPAAPGDAERELRWLRLKASMIRARDKRKFDYLCGLTQGIFLTAGLEEAPQAAAGAGTSGEGA